MNDILVLRAKALEVVETDFEDSGEDWVKFSVWVTRESYDKAFGDEL